MTDYQVEDIARIFGIPVEALAGARRIGLLKRLHWLLWGTLVMKYAGIEGRKLGERLRAEIEAAQ